MAQRRLNENEVESDPHATTDNVAVVSRTKDGTPDQSSDHAVMLDAKGELKKEFRPDAARERAAESSAKAAPKRPGGS